MTDELHEDIKQILQKTTRIETALWPDEGQPGVLTRHDERLDALEGWRNYIVGAWAVVTSLFGWHTLGGGHK